VFEAKVIRNSKELVWTTKWQKALADIKDEKVRISLTSFHERTATLVATRLVFGSPVLILLLLCAMLTVVVHKGLQSIRQLLDEAASSTISQVVDARLLEEEAVKAAAA
jgi:hypothetical protein